MVRRARRSRTRNTARYKTQPITFDEIKEVDEEPTSEDAHKAGLKNQFAAFSRSMDGLLPGYPVASGGKENATEPPTATAGTTAETSSSISSDTTVRSEHAHSASAMSLYNESFRRRRKKKQQRSIEEVPETEKTEDTVPTVG